MNALVVGMGKTGLSIARHFLAAGGAVVAADSRPIPPCLNAFSSLPGIKDIICAADFSRWCAADFAGFDRIALSPGVSPKTLRAPSAKITGDAALFADSWRENPGETRLFAFTGTNGKSTTVALAAELCRAAGLRAEAIGNIGAPVLDSVARWREQGAPQIAAVELSSFQLETAESFPADCATVLNISGDHLDRHDSMDEYAAIKSRIYRGAKKRAANLDDKFAAPPDSPDITYSAKRAADFQLCGDEVIYDGGRISVRDCIAPPQNVLAALAILSPLKLPHRALEKGLASFAGLPHRRQLVGDFGGVSFVDDSKATNVKAACFALADIAGDVLLIAGGDGKGQDFAPLAACANVKKAFLFGKDADSLRRAMQSGGIACDKVCDMRAAVDGAIKIAQCGDTVLCSPACSSLDMYRDYAARGDDFAAACRAAFREAN